MAAPTIDKTVPLRVEMTSPQETVVSYARAFSPSTISVITDYRPALGTRVEVRVSFPTLLEPITAWARVIEHFASGGVGDPHGLKLAFEFESEDARTRLAEIVERLNRRVDADGLAGRTFSVLLVEDSPLIREMFAYGVSKFFREKGATLRFDHAADALTARQKLAGESYDLLIVDHFLPSEDGATFIARLRKNERFAKVPVVAISVGGRDARDATISAGADVFLDKPVALRDLFNMLTALAQDRRLL